jgi:hypothetical protein
VRNRRRWHAGGNLPPTPLTPGANLPLESTTPVVTPVLRFTLILLTTPAKNCHHCTIVNDTLGNLPPVATTALVNNDKHYHIAYT